VKISFEQRGIFSPSYYIISIASSVTPGLSQRGQGHVRVNTFSIKQLPRKHPGLNQNLPNPPLESKWTRGRKWNTRNTYRKSSQINENSFQQAKATLALTPTPTVLILSLNNTLRNEMGCETRLMNDMNLNRLQKFYFLKNVYVFLHQFSPFSTTTFFLLDAI